MENFEQSEAHRVLAKAYSTMPVGEPSVNIKISREAFKNMEPINGLEFIQEREWFIFKDVISIKNIDEYLAKCKQYLEDKISKEVRLCDQAISINTKIPETHTVRLFFKTIDFIESESK